MCRRGLSTNVAPGPSDPHAYCKDFVRKHDYDSYLNSYFYPRALQNGYFATKAFSVELAMVQDNVSNAMIGKMRMQFWRDAVKEIREGRPPKHPIALALHETSENSKTSAYHLKRIVDARDAELQTSSFLTVDSLTSHAEATSSTVLYLLLSLLSLPSSTLSHAASHLGTAQTCTTLLRALPFHAKHGRMVIPAEITAKHGVSQEDVFRHGGDAQGIEDAVFDFATVAHDHLNTAYDMLKAEGSQGRVPGDALPVFLAGVPVANYLRRLEKVGFNAFDPKLQRRDGLLAWQMWLAYYRKRL
ncbi:isoprenoid synthase domain-containing protein [Pholiota molesta]|nr:isoprenoid synthase domain-containing protein [Pholiota molesta]